MYMHTHSYTEQAAVTELYHFNAHYFEHHDVSLAGQKAKDVSEKMKGAVSLLDSLQEHLPKVQYLSLKGRALNILPEFSKEAEECLSKAVKQDPSLVEAWCSLGESYWKASNVQQAHDCFKGSLAHVCFVCSLVPRLATPSVLMLHAVCMQH